jgi:hypothetical protein
MVKFASAVTLGAMSTRRENKAGRWWRAICGMETKVNQWIRLEDCTSDALEAGAQRHVFIMLISGCHTHSGCSSKWYLEAIFSEPRFRGGLCYGTSFPHLIKRNLATEIAGRWLQATPLVRRTLVDTEIAFKHAAAQHWSLRIEKREALRGGSISYAHEDLVHMCTYKISALHVRSNVSWHFCT